MGGNKNQTTKKYLFVFRKTAHIMSFIAIKIIILSTINSF